MLLSSIWVKKKQKTHSLILRPNFQVTMVDFGRWSQSQKHPTQETPANHIKAPLTHTDFYRTQSLTSSKKTIKNKPEIDPEMLVLHSINLFTNKIHTNTNINHLLAHRWFQVFHSNTNNSIYSKSFVCNS